jgi:hypothetical protein
MTDMEMWDNAVTVVRREYRALADPIKERLRSIIREVRLEKTEVCSITASRGASHVCSGCGGRCCHKGKYHFSVIDLLAFLDTGRDLFLPAFGGVSCPYLGKAGCLMEPPYRPFTCVTFHCDRLEALLTASEVERLYGLERSLRVKYGDIEELFGTRLTQGLLLGYARYLEGACAGILVAGR